MMTVKIKTKTASWGKRLLAVEIWIEVQ